LLVRLLRTIGSDALKQHTRKSSFSFVVLSCRFLQPCHVVRRYSLPRTAHVTCMQFVLINYS